jgi:hypothetical protein
MPGGGPRTCRCASSTKRRGGFEAYDSLRSVVNVGGYGVWRIETRVGDTFRAAVKSMLLPPVG